MLGGIVCPTCLATGDDLFMGEGRFGMQVGNGNAARGFDL